MIMEVGGLCEVMSWVLGFGRHAEVLEHFFEDKRKGWRHFYSDDFGPENGRLRVQKPCF
ncbi:MAG: hypothetical protein HWN68_00620 [Desulfobacterales bacterium]|nr:hypothetical protein [Desulfobacterales bacterium]